MNYWPIQTRPFYHQPAAVWLITQLCVQALSPWALSQDNVPSAALTPLDVDGMRRELARLDVVCERLNLSDERVVMQRWLPSNATDAQLLWLPVDADPSLGESENNVRGNRPADAEEAHANWSKHFARARLRHAAHWFGRAAQSAQEGDEWAAYRQLWQAAREDAAHAETRRALGTMLSGLATKAKPRVAAAPHAQFGWPAGSYARMETSNFKITSRLEAETTQAIARKLEEFYALWTQVFYPLWAPPNVTKARLAGRNSPWSRKLQMDVVLCKDRHDYLQVLGANETNIGVSVGYYNPSARMSFFYPEPGFEATLYHELTHQLLAEASQLKSAETAGEKADFWLVEAVALYMESLSGQDFHWRVGGWTAPRMQAARYRGLHDGFWIEPDQLSAVGKQKWKSDPEIGKLYTHVAGLAHYFLDPRAPRAASEPPVEGSDERSTSARAAEDRLDRFDWDKSRAAFFNSLVSVYSGQGTGDRLWQLLDDGDPQQNYVHFLLVRDRHLATSQPHHLAEIEELVLTRSQISDSAWVRLNNCRKLKWLDVSFSNATSDRLQWIPQMRELERLSVEGTAIEASTLEAIGKLDRLQELDLSACPVVDDQVLRKLGSAKRLETLYLSDTPIGPRSVDYLKSLASLRSVTVSNTQIPAEQAESLTAELSRRSKQ